jgi:hypothetical protein
MLTLELSLHKFPNTVGSFCPVSNSNGQWLEKSYTAFGTLKTTEPIALVPGITLAQFTNRGN